MNEPRVYKNSPFIFGLMILIFGVLFVGLFASIGNSNDWYIMVPFGLIFGIVFLFVFLSITSKTIISDSEISTQNILGTKTLQWNEINRVSGRGYGIKLHNIHGDITVFPSVQLPGYSEVIEWIGLKRPDLFNPVEYSEMSKSWAGTALFPMIGLAMIGFGVFVYIQASDAFFPFIIMSVFGIVFIAMTFTTAQAVTIQGNSIVIGYLFNEKTLLADEITSVDLRYTQTRNGKNYFVALNLVNRKTIRLSGLKPNLPVVYLVLKNWQKKSTSTRQTIGLN